MAAQEPNSRPSLIALLARRPQQTIITRSQNPGAPWQLTGRVNFKDNKRAEPLFTDGQPEASQEAQLDPFYNIYTNPNYAKDLQRWKEEWGDAWRSAFTRGIPGKAIRAAQKTVSALLKLVR